MLERLDGLVDESSGLKSKLLLLVDAPQGGKTRLLNELAKSRQLRVIKVSSALGRQLISFPVAHRHLKTAELLKNLVESNAADGPVLLDNIELLFDQTLQLNPLDLLKRQAQSRPIVAVWPGEIRNNRLTYATLGHPEYRDYSIDGVVIFKVV